MRCCKLLHKTIYNNIPKAIVQYLRQSNITIVGERAVRHTFITRPSRTTKTDKSFFYRGIKMYNSLPQSLKYLEPKKFNKKIKETIRSKFCPDIVP